MWYNFDVGRITKFLLLIFAILYGAYYWAIPALVKLPENIVFEEYKIALGNPTIKTGVIPSVKFSAQDVALLNDDNTKAFEIKNPNIDIRLIPLLFKRVDIQDFTADEINADIALDKDKNIKLGQYKLKTDLPAPKVRYYNPIRYKGTDGNWYDGEIINNKYRDLVVTCTKATEKFPVHIEYYF